MINFNQENHHWPSNQPASFYSEDIIVIIHSMNRNINTNTENMSQRKELNTETDGVQNGALWNTAGT